MPGVQPMRYLHITGEAALLLITDERERNARNLSNGYVQYQAPFTPHLDKDPSTFQLCLSLYPH